MKDRIYLAPPNVDMEETKAVEAALDSGWIAPAGPSIEAFEQSLSTYFSNKQVLLTNSGTSALHLSLILAGVQEGDKVLSNSMTFAACPNTICYQHAQPVFMDCEKETWSIDPQLLEDYLKKVSVIPKALIVTHLYGIPARLEELTSVAHAYDMVVIEDAAEAVGSNYKGKPVGMYGDFGVISFNGNKIITSSGGGALICTKDSYLEGLHLATQANRGLKSYDHDRLGYNYRMSNILASIGKAQFSKLDRFLKVKKQIIHRYQKELADHLSFHTEYSEGTSNHWLSAGLIKSEHPPGDLIDWMEKYNIECRRFWKPLHLHAAYKKYEFVGNGVCESLYERGVCLPSGTGLTNQEQTYVIQKVKDFFEHQ